MSTFKVEVCEVLHVEAHPGADRLEIATIKGWQCVVGKGQFKAGDACVYVPIDAILPPEIEAKIFGPDAKIKLSNGRVRTIKLRGAISQGLATTREQLGLDTKRLFQRLPVGTDVTHMLGITKYEPPVKESPQNKAGLKTSPKQSNPHFHKYTGLENAKNYPNIFDESDVVIVTEKIHGTNFRAGWVPFHADTLLKKVKALFGFAPKWEFVYGSHNVQLQSKLLDAGFYESNIYAEAVRKYDLKNKLGPGEVVYGEIYGDGVQKNYMYGCAAGERKLVLFDLKLDGRFVDYWSFARFVDERQLPAVPVLAIGPFHLDTIKHLTVGNSYMAPEQKFREGVVVKPVGAEETTYMGRKILKFISDAYLLREETSWH